MENEQLYRAVQRTLVVGMAISFSLMGLGLLAALLNPQGATADPVVLRDLPAAALRFEPGAILALGVLTLMFIPAVHLLVMFVSFLRMRDRRYALIAAIVLALLAVGAGLPLLRG